MDLERIKALIDAMAASDLAEIECAEGDWSLRLVRHAEAPARSAAMPSPPPPRGGARLRPSPVAASASDDGVRAPMFGVVYLRPAPDAPDFVRPGQEVAAGTVLCIVEAMKVFNEVRAPRAGTLAEILVSTDEEVEAGQILMRLQ